MSEISESEIKSMTKEQNYMRGYENGKSDVLDKIRVKIEGWQVDIHDNEYDADEHDFVFERIFEIIDEYKAEGNK